MKIAETGLSYFLNDIQEDNNRSLRKPQYFKYL